MARKEGAKAVSIVFRIAALALSVAATVVMGTASQLVVLDGGGGGRRWSSYVVSYNNYTALVYFVVSGVIGAVCSAAGLYLTAVKTAGGGGGLVPFVDVVAQGFLFSAAGAAFAGGSTGRGVCDAAGAFCGKVTAAAAVGAVAAVAVAVAALASSSSKR